MTTTASVLNIAITTGLAASVHKALQAHPSLYSTLLHGLTSFLQKLGKFLEPDRAHMKPSKSVPEATVPRVPCDLLCHGPPE